LLQLQDADLEARTILAHLQFDVFLVNTRHFDAGSQSTPRFDMGKTGARSKFYFAIHRSTFLSLTDKINDVTDEIQ